MTIRMAGLVLLGVALGLDAGAAASRVDFSYAFATPHRMAVARPDSSDKTLLDLEPGSLRLGWTYETLLNYPLAAFATPPAVWGAKLTPKLDNAPFGKSAWTRVEGYLPALDNLYEDPAGTLRLEVVGGKAGALVRVTMCNTGAEERAFSVLCESQRGFFGYNPAFVDPVYDRDCLLAGWGDRADRVIVLGACADEYAVEGATTLRPVWHVKPGETRVGWIVRPYRGYAAELPALRGGDWQREFDIALAEWRGLIGSAVTIAIPDPGVVNAFRACIGDLFIMREPVADGYIAATPGTDGYRAPNSGEASIVAVALDQLGLHELSANGYRMCLDLQGDDGNWADPQGWGHLWWGCSGFKSWTAMEHFLLTGDRAYLERVYPRMRASSLFQEASRARMRVMNGSEKALTYGLMPPGMGDCGLKDGDNLYGVFVPQNIWAVYGDKISVETARILGQDADLDTLQGIYDTANTDFLAALDRGAIAEGDYRWIPGVLGKTCGSRWGALNASFPCGLLAPDDPLIAGTLRYIRSRMSPGGLPMNTGWLENGMWVAISLDNLAEVHLQRDEGDEAAALLYATLNHGTPLVTWCEERGPEPGATTITGDRQHLWTPVAVVRAIRDYFVMEQDDVLHLARGIDREWLGGGEPVGIEDAPTHFGHATFRMQYDAAAKRVRGRVTLGLNLSGAVPLAKMVMHIRPPQPLRVVSVNEDSGATVLPDGSGIAWAAFVGERNFEAMVE